MDLYFRKYFWTATAAFTLAAAFLSARIVNTLLGAAIVPPATSLLAPAHPGGQRPQAETHPDPDPHRVASLFGVKLPESTSEQAAAEPALKANDYNAEPVKTTLRAVLMGTIVATPDQYSLAVITNDEIKETKVYGVGDKLMNVAVVLTVERHRVIVFNESEHHREYIDDTPGTGQSLATVAPLNVTGVPPPGGPLAAASGIKETAPNNYAVPRKEIDNAIANMSDLATKARIVPSFKNGVSNGFKLFSIMPDSLYAKIGIQNGDVIKKINGYDMNSPEKAMEIYTKLLNATHVDVEIERHGDTLRKNYAIDN